MSEPRPLGARGTHSRAGETAGGEGSTYLAVQRRVLAKSPHLAGAELDHAVMVEMTLPEIKQVIKEGVYQQREVLGEARESVKAWQSANPSAI